MLNARVAAVLVLLLAPPALADTVFLKAGQRLEGDVTEKGSNYEIKTAAGAVVIPKSEVAKVVRSLEAIKAEAEGLHAKARTLYEEGLKLEDAKAANEKLKAGAELLRKIIDLYVDARETYADEKYASIDQTLVALLQEMRLFRDKMSSEIAPANVPPPEQPGARPEEKPAPPALPPPPAKPSPAADAKPALPRIDLAALQAKAKGGDLDAQYDLAVYADFREWTALEAAKGYKALGDRRPQAAWRLGMLYLFGRGVKQDFKKALDLFQKAESNGLALAQVQIGRMYFDGMGLPKNLKKADEYCDRAERKIRTEALAGDAESLVALGWMYLEGMGAPKVPEYGVQCYQRAAELGYLPAYYRLGQLYQTGTAVPKNKTEAMKYMQVAADEGMAEAIVAMGELTYPENAEAGDFSRTVEWQKKGLAQGHPQAFYRLGQDYMKGRGVPKDEAQALKLWQDGLRTATGWVQSTLINDLGYAYSHGQGGLARDPKEAIKYYKMAADLGLPMGMHNVGALTDHELKNPGEAIKWYLSASKLGYAHSSRMLGEHYAKGDGVTKNLDEAERWYLVAIQQGDAVAPELLKRVQNERASATKKK